MTPIYYKAVFSLVGAHYLYMRTKHAAPRSMQRETAGAGKCAKCGENQEVNVCVCAVKRESCEDDANGVRI